MQVMPPEVIHDIRARAHLYFSPKRRAISLRYPRIGPLAIVTHQTLGTFQRFFTASSLKISKKSLPILIYKHGSLLRRKLGVSDPDLQERKIHNLTIAIRLLDGIIIPQGKVFSFWKILGAITDKKGYVKGMLLSRGKVTEGIGGGLCQLSNLLYWMFLHSPMEILERHHHSFDPFPDNGRTLPFGSGATIMDRILDLQVRNISDQPLQLRLWLSETHLYGALYGIHPLNEKYHVSELHPFFVRINDVVFRYNQLIRETVRRGAVVRTEAIATNFAPAVYPVPPERVTDFVLPIVR